MSRSSGGEAHPGLDGASARMWSDFEPIVNNPRGVASLEDLPIDETRRAMDTALKRWSGPGPEMAGVRDLEVSGPDGPVPMRIYTPLRVQEPLALVVLIHGGGFVMGGIASYDGVAREMAASGECTVASVGYALAPERPFPHGLDEAYHAYVWLRQHAHEQFGVDRSRIGVWGDSSGGTIAAAVTLMARDAGIAPKAQCLVYPALGAGLATSSWDSHGEGYWLTRTTMAWFWKQYLGARRPGDSGLAEPLHADSLAGLPPTLLVSASLDPLLDENREYAARLRAHGVPVDHRVCEGAIHGFAGMAAVSERAGARLREYAKAFAAMLRDDEAGSA